MQYYKIENKLILQEKTGNPCMSNSEPKITHVETMSKDLSSFAIDRSDLKELMGSIPKQNHLNLTTIEYELSILKILSTGWGISFYMPATDPKKSLLSDTFWTAIRDISNQISTLAQTTSGHTIDYFNILKERLDSYVARMQEDQKSSADPAAIIGPSFADICGCPGNPIAILIGTKMFALTLGAVKEYLDIYRNDASQPLN